MSDGTRTTFKVTVAGRRVVDFSTLRKGDKFILQDDDHPLSMEKGNVCNVATSDAYLRGGIWTIDCEEIEGSGKRIKRGSHPDDWNKPFTIKSSSKVTKEDLLNDDPIFPFTTRPSEVAEEITKIEDERTLATLLGASKDFLEGPTTYSTTRFQVWEKEGAYSVPVQFVKEVAALEEPDCAPIVDDLPRVAATIKMAADVLSAAGGEEGCPSCGSPEADAMTPRTVYACGSSDYDQRPGTFSQKCGGGEE